MTSNEPVSLTQVEIMNALTLGIPLYTHPVKEHFEDEPQAEELHEILQSNSHPVKELHLSLQKSKQPGELLAVTYTDDEHRIVEVLWQRPPEAQLMLTHEEINDAWKQSHEDGVAMQQGFTTQQHYFAHLILRKANEK